MLERIIRSAAVTRFIKAWDECNVDYDVAIGKSRAATPHMAELEAIVRRGF